MMNIPYSLFHTVKHQKRSIGSGDFGHLGGFLKTQAGGRPGGGGVLVEGPVPPGSEGLPQNRGSGGGML